MVKTVEMKVYRKLYINFLTIICLMIIGSYFLVRNGISIRWEATQSKMIKNILLFGMIAMAIAYTIYLRKQKDILQGISDFSEKIIFHEKYFKIREHKASI